MEFKNNVKLTWKIRPRFRRICKFDWQTKFDKKNDGRTTMAIRPCQRSWPTANSLQANALCEFAGTSSIAQRWLQVQNDTTKLKQIS